MSQQYPPPPPPPGYHYGPPPQRSGLGIAAMVIGIVALVLSFIPVIGLMSFLLGPLAVILGFVAIAGRHGRGQGIAGVITGALGTIVVLAGVLIFGSIVSDVEREMRSTQDDAAQDEDDSAADDEESEHAEAEEAREEESEAAEAREEEEGDEPTPAASEDGEQGSRENPYDVGETVSHGDWEVTMNDVTIDADDQIAAENLYNESAPDGQQYALVNITATYHGDASEMPMMGIDVAYVAGGGETSRSYDTIVVTPDDFDTSTELYPGGTEEGNVALAVPQDDDDGAFRVRIGLVDTQDFSFSAP